MKKAMKKLLCVVLVLMMAMPLIVLPASAEAPTYDDFEENDLMYKVNFKGGDGVFVTPSNAWATMSTKTVSGDGRSVTLKPKSASGQTGAVWGSELVYPNYRMVESAYAAVFTLTASDANQEIGFYPDWNTGFIIKPGSNSFRYGVGKDGTTIEGTTGTYTRADGKAPLTQTYAIEIKDEGSDNGAASDDYSAFTYDITEYNLYVLDGYDWQLLFQFSDSKNADAAKEIESNLKWITEGAKNYEYVIRFYRNRKDANQDGTVTVSNMDIYKGLAVTNGAVEMDPRAYYRAADGEKLFAVEFDGANTKWQQTYGKPSGTSWAEMTTRELSSDKKTVTLKPGTNSSKEAAVYGGCLDPVNYPAQGNSYTIAYTVTASDANQEVSFYADWSTGFSVIPGQNKFGYKSTTADSNQKRTVDELVVPYDEYDGTGSLTQTYAVEYKLDDSFNATEYNLYVANDGEWVLLYSLNENERSKTKWTSSDCEVVIRFCRDGENEYQTDGTVTISDVNVYKGFAAKSGKATVPADYIHADYSAAEYGDIIYKVNFKGDATYKPASSWGGMTVPTKTLTENSVALRAKSEADNNDDYTYAEKGSIWGGAIDDKVYPMLGHSYTAVFTVTASDADEAVGLYLDWQTGFIVTPGQNTYGYRVSENGNGENGKVYYDKIALDTPYNGTGSLTQTYAIEVKDNGADDVYNCVAYNLYVAKNGEWMLIESLSGDELDWCMWSTKDYEYVLRFYRDSRIEGNSGTVTISDMSIYKGLAASTGAVTVETKTVSYKDAGNGELLYNVNFKGDSIYDPNGIYDGMNETVSSDGSSVVLKPNSDAIPAVSGAVLGADLGTSNKEDPNKATYPAVGAAYTLVFTVSAEDENQSVGILGKWRDGIFLTPGQNKYSLGKVHNNKDSDGNPKAEEDRTAIGEDLHGGVGTYAGAKALTQTYAIEFANGSEADGNGKYELEKYNLWVLQDGAWVLVREFDEEERAKLAWDTGDYELVLHLARIASGEGDDEGKVTVSDVKLYKGNGILPEAGIRNGASVRLDDPTGIRFTGAVTKDYYNALVSKYGEVTLGILIAPTDYISTYQVAFTKEAFEASGVQYLEIDGSRRTGANHYYVNCAMVNINPGNYNRAFSARLYIKDADGNIVEYSSYNPANNSRSVATVAERAYNDVSTTQNSAYKNAITIGDIAVSYSPYTAEEREILGTFFDVEDPTPDSSISVMTYNIKGTNSDREEKRDITKAYSFIANSGVDVIGLQEDDDYNASAILALNSDYALVSGSNNGNGNEDNAIIYNTTKFKVVNSGGSVYFKKLVDTKDVYQQVLNITVTGKEFIDTNGDNKVDTAAGDEVTVSPNFEYDQMGDSEGWLWNKEDKGRFFRWVVLEDIETGVQYIVVNTHLHYRKTSTASDKDSEASSPMNKAVRQAQAMLIKLWLESDDTAKKYANAVVMGDLNGQHDSNVLNSLTDNGALRQARDEAVMIIDDWGTLVEEEYNTRKKWIYDHVVYNSDALVAAKFTVVDNKLTGTDAEKANYPSDHLPVAAEFYYYN